MAVRILLVGPRKCRPSNRPDPVPEVTWYASAGYVDDTWKVNKKLTVNLGLRYDFTRHGIVPGGYSSNFLYYPKPHIEMSKDQCRKGLSPSYLELTAKDGIAITCADGNGLVEGKRFQLSPRVGIAYQITPKFILRTGFGFFYGISQPASTLRSITQNYPFSYDVDFTTMTRSARSFMPTGPEPRLKAVWRRSILRIPRISMPGIWCLAGSPIPIHSPIR